MVIAIGGRLYAPRKCLQHLLHYWPDRQQCRQQSHLLPLRIAHSPTVVTTVTSVPALNWGVLALIQTSEATEGSGATPQHLMSPLKASLHLLMPLCSPRQALLCIVSRPLWLVPRVWPKVPSLWLGTDLRLPGHGRIFVAPLPKTVTSCVAERRRQLCC